MLYYAKNRRLGQTPVIKAGVADAVYSKAGLLSNRSPGNDPPSSCRLHPIIIYASRLCKQSWHHPPPKFSEDLKANYRLVQTGRQPPPILQLSCFDPIPLPQKYPPGLILSNSTEHSRHHWRFPMAGKMTPHAQYPPPTDSGEMHEYVRWKHSRQHPPPRPLHSRTAFMSVQLIYPPGLSVLHSHCSASRDTAKYWQKMTDNWRNRWRWRPPDLLDTRSQYPPPLEGGETIGPAQFKHNFTLGHAPPRRRTSYIAYLYARFRYRLRCSLQQTYSPALYPDARNLIVHAMDTLMPRLIMWLARAWMKRPLPPTPSTCAEEQWSCDRNRMKDIGAFIDSYLYIPVDSVMVISDNRNSCGSIKMPGFTLTDHDQDHETIEHEPATYEASVFTKISIQSARQLLPSAGKNWNHNCLVGKYYLVKDMLHRTSDMP